MQKISHLMLITLVFAIFGIAAAVFAESSSDSAPPPQERRDTTTKPAEKHMDEGKLTEQQETELLDLLREKRPDFYEHLMRLKKDQPGRYHSMLRRSWKWYQDWKRMPEEIRQAALEEQDARLQAFKLASQIRQQNDNPNAIADLKLELEATLNRQFEAQQKIAHYRIEELQKKIAKLQEQIEQRAANRKNIIENQMNEILKSPGPRKDRPDKHPRRDPLPPDADKITTPD